MKRLDLHADDKIKLLAYGQGGAGKTHLLYSAAKDPAIFGRVLGIDCGGNPQSIRRQELLPDVVQLETLADLNPLYTWLASGQKADAAFAAQNGLTPPYGTLVFDGVTVLQRLSFALVTGSEKALPGSIPPKVERQHFGAVLSQMTLFASRFFALPMHVLISALERDDTPAPDQPSTYRPLLLGQAANEVNGYALLVARIVHAGAITGAMRQDAGISSMIPKQVQSVAFFRPGRTWYAKDQYGLGVAYLFNPTMKDIYDRMGSGPAEVANVQE